MRDLVAGRRVNRRTLLKSVGAAGMAGLAGCPTMPVEGSDVGPSVGASDPTPEGDTPASHVTVSLDFGSVVDEAEQSVTPEAGGTVRLSDGAALAVPAGALDLSTEVRLIRAAPPPGTADGLVSDVYFPVSTDRPRALGPPTLTIPYDPAEVAETALQAYAVLGPDIVYPVPSTVDPVNHVVSIPDPTVRALRVPTPFASSHAGRGGSGALGLPTGYAIGDIGRSVICRSGSSGEVLERPDSPFRIVFTGQASCDFAEYVDTTLREAVAQYNAAYADLEGNQPFSYYSPDIRMTVYLGEFDNVNGQYYPWSWRGWMEIDVAASSGDLVQLRGTLFHEMFHAVQDFYSNMFVGGIEARWWYEATGEWAGLKARGLTFEEAVRDEFQRFPYALSVHVPLSEQFDPSLPYAYAPLIDYVEQQRPGYVYDTLNAIANRGSLALRPLGSELYAGLRDAGNLRETYADYLGRVMAAQLPGNIWAAVTVLERPEVTRILSRPPGSPIGSGDSTFREITDDAQRYDRPLQFTPRVQPQTAMFYRLRLAGPTGFRGVSVTLTRDGQPSRDALLIVLPADATQGQVGPPTRMFEGGHARGTFDEQNHTLLIAVYNDADDFARDYQLDVTLTKPEQETFIPRQGSSTVYCVDGTRSSRPDPNSSLSETWWYDLRVNPDGTLDGGTIGFRRCDAPRGYDTVQYHIEPSSQTPVQRGPRSLTVGARKSVSGPASAYKDSLPDTQTFTISVNASGDLSISPDFSQ